MGAVFVGDEVGIGIHTRMRVLDRSDAFDAGIQGKEDAKGGCAHNGKLTKWFHVCDYW